MNRWHKKVVGASLFALGLLTVVGAGGTMMMEASTGYAGPQTGFGKMLLTIAIGSGLTIIGAALHRAGTKPRRMHYLGNLLSR